MACWTVWVGKQLVMEPNTLGCCYNPSSLYAPENIGSLSLAPQDGSFIMLVEMEDWNVGLEVELLRKIHP